MVEIFFIKRFLVEYMMPYIVLSTSVFYLLLEVFAPRSIKERLYIFLDKVYCRFVVSFIRQIKFTVSIFISNAKLNAKKMILKRREKLKRKEIKKNKKEEKKNEKSKVKLNKKINRINSKVDKYNKKIKKKNKRNKIFKGIFRKEKRKNKKNKG